MRVPVSAATPAPISRKRRSSVSRAPIECVRAVPVMRTSSGITLRAAPPWIDPKVSTAGSRESTARGKPVVRARDELHGRRDRIGRVMRPCGMTADTANHDVDLVAVGRQRAAREAGAAEASFRIDVQTDDRIDVVDGAGRDHLLAPVDVSSAG